MFLACYLGGGNFIPKKVRLFGRLEAQTLGGKPEEERGDFPIKLQDKF